MKINIHKFVETLIVNIFLIKKKLKNKIINNI